jgi:UDP-N-acetylglucosamine 2-epimerase (non-hydrolysing)
MKLLVPFGTRPEIVKLAPVVEAFRGSGDEVVAVATGQHDDPLLTDAFFADLALVPDRRHELPPDDAARAGLLLTHAYEDVGSITPDAVLVLGDTNTVPAYGLAARRFGVPVVHLEAGLRSFNARSLEEVNRRVAAATASLHLAPTELASRFLADEGVPEERRPVVGNPITDVLRRLAPPRVPIEHRAGALLTAHRATNVDDPDRLARLVDIVQGLAGTLGSVRFPVHPRTEARLAASGALAVLAGTPGVTLESPLRYPEMLRALAQARVVVTDSGGLQEEASWFGVPVVVLRASTPRWEGVLDGTARLVGLEVPGALAAAAELTAPDALLRASTLPCPYGDGHVSPRIVAAVHSAATDGLLRLAEPVPGAPLPIEHLLAEGRTAPTW